MKKWHESRVAYAKQLGNYTEKGTKPKRNKRAVCQNCRALKRGFCTLRGVYMARKGFCENFKRKG